MRELKNIIKKFHVIHTLNAKKNLKSSLTNDFRKCIYVLVKTARLVLQDYRSDSLSANYNAHKTPCAFVNRKSCDHGGMRLTDNARGY